MIRHATLEDLFDILVLAREFARESPYAKSWDKEKSATWIKNAIESDQMCMLVAEDEDGYIVGGLLGVATELFMSTEKIASELAWFTTKTERGKPSGLRLMKAFEDWGRSIGATKLVMADLRQVQEMDKLYKRKGFTEMERSYVKEI